MTQGNGILLDLDETLVVTKDTWREMHATILGPFGYERTPQVHDRITGRNVLDQAELMHDMLNIPIPVEVLKQQMRDRLIHNFETVTLEPMPGACELVERLRGLAPIAVASGSPLPAIKAAVQRLGLAKYMTALISSESVEHGKPAPDVFLKAADMIDAEPKHCVVFEDSAHGAEAGQRAGMKTIVCAKPHGPVTIEHARPFTTRMVDHWDEVTREQVAAMLAASS